MIVVRYADDMVVGFEHEADARRFWERCAQRLRGVCAILHPEKTRLIEFGRYRSGQSRAAWAWKTGDLHVSRLYLHLR